MESDTRAALLPRELLCRPRVVNLLSVDAFSTSHCRGMFKFRQWSEGKGGVAWWVGVDEDQEDEELQQFTRQV